MRVLLCHVRVGALGRGVSLVAGGRVAREWLAILDGAESTRISFPRAAPHSEAPRGGGCPRPWADPGDPGLAGPAWK